MTLTNGGRWTESGVQYLGVYAVYMRKYQMLRNGVVAHRYEVALNFMSVSPMEMSDEDVDGEAPGSVREERHSMQSRM